MSLVLTMRQSLTLTWRSLLKIRHSPDQLLDVTLMPITFVVIFVFLFGNAVSGNWHAYLEFVLPGVAVQALLFGSLNTALGFHNDARTGVFDRFRSMPLAPSAPLIGRVLGDVVRNVLSLILVAALGLILGFRPHGSPLRWLAGCGLILLFAFGICWVSVLIGVLAKTPEAIQALSFAMIFLLAFGSNVFVPTGKLPGWLQAWVKINPVSQAAGAGRALLLNMPAGHFILASLLWTAGIAVVFGAAAVALYRRSG
jgi:oleandomycin transport system permease protein